MAQVSDSTKYHYADSIITPKHICCGVILRSLCIGHLILLDAINSPVLSEAETDIRFEMFIVSVLICGMKYEDGLNFIQSMLDDTHEYKEQLKLFRKKFIKDMRTKEWFSLKVENLIFNDYLSFYIKSMPSYETMMDNKQLPSGLDWKCSLINLIQKYKGISESEALNMSLRKLYYDWSSILESEGAIRVTSTDDIPVTVKRFDKEGNEITE